MKEAMNLSLYQLAAAYLFILGYKSFFNERAQLKIDD